MAVSSELEPEAEIAVFCAMQLETDSLSKLLTTGGKEKNYWQDPNGNLHIVLTTPGLRHLILPPRAYAQNETGTVAQKLLSQYPSIRRFVFLGVGGGVPPAARGDIVASNEVVNISQKKILPTGKARVKPIPTPASKELYRHAEQIRDRMKLDPSWWEERKTEAYDVLGYHLPEIIPRLIGSGKVRSAPEPWVGLIASSNDNVNNKKIRDGWKAYFKKMGRKLYSFEMEGSALAEVAWGEERQILIVRGVSDLSDGEERDLDDDVQPYAARNAAIFLAELLKSLPTKAEEEGEVYTGEFKMYELGTSIAGPENSSRRLLLIQRTSSIILGPEPFVGTPYYYDNKFSKACLRRIKDVKSDRSFSFHYFYSGEKTALKLIEYLNDNQVPVSKKKEKLFDVIQRIKRFKAIESATSSAKDTRFRFDSITAFSGPFAVGDREVAVWLAEKGSGADKESLVVSTKSEGLAKKVFHEYSKFVKKNPTRAEDLLKELAGYLNDEQRGLKGEVKRALRKEMRILLGLE